MDNPENISPGFKPAPLCQLPNDWVVKKFFEIAEVKGGKRIPKGESLTTENTGFPYIRVSDMFMGGVNSSNILFVPKHVEPSIKNYKIRKGELFITVAGTIGLVGIIPDELDSANLTENANKIIVKNADKKYVLYYLMSDKIQRIIKETTTNNAQPKLALERIREIEFALPPLNEQNAITSVLSTWDEAISKTQQLINQLKTRNNSVQQRLLTGKKRLNGHEKSKWIKVNADSIFKSVSTKNNNDNEQLLSITQDRGAIPRDMLEARVTMPSGDTNSFKLVEPGDFIISLRSFQGGIEYSEYKGLVSPAYTVLKPKKQIDNNFYKYYFKSYDFIGHLAVAVVGIRDGKQISFDDFGTVKLPYPSPEEQSKIAEVLTAADNEVKIQEQKLATLKQQKKGLMQKLLTGKIRVKIEN